MNDIKYEVGMTMETLVKEINSRLETVRTMHDMNNININAIDFNFRKVFEEFEKLGNNVDSKIDQSTLKVIQELQKGFKELKKDIGDQKA